MSQSLTNYRLYLIIIEKIDSCKIERYLPDLINQDIDLFPIQSLDIDRYPRNRSILVELEHQRIELSKIIKRNSALSLIYLSLLASRLLDLNIIKVKTLILERLNRASRTQIVVKNILENFGDDGAKIDIEIETAYGTIDVFVKLKDRRLFAFVLRSNGANYIEFDNNIKSFWIYRKNKGKVAVWHSTKQMLDSFADMTTWLRETRHAVLGTSSAQIRKPVVKAIVLTGDTRLHLLHQDSDELVEFGQARVLKIDIGFITYLLELEDLIAFVLPKIDLKS